MIGQPLLNKSAYNTTRHRSASIWGLFDVYQWLENPTQFYYWFDDFHNVPDLSADADDDMYASWIDTGNTIRALATEKTRGVLRMACDASDNDAVVIGTQGNNGTSIMFDDNSAPDNRMVLYETRWRSSVVTAGTFMMFQGFAEEGRVDDDGFFADADGGGAGVLADIDLIGFQVDENTSALDFTWKKAGQTRQEHTAILTTSNAASATLAVDTWYKTGLVYRPAPYHEDAKRIKIIVNGVEYTSYVTATQMAAATFPDGEEMAWYACLKLGVATATNLDLDWLGIMQEQLDS